MLCPKSALQLDGPPANFSYLRVRHSLSSRIDFRLDLADRGLRDPSELNPMGTPAENAFNMD